MDALEARFARRGRVAWAIVALALAIAAPQARAKPEDRRDLGGRCLACPSFDFGPFTPTANWQTHAAVLSGPGDCNRYQFAVVAGHRYEVSTCAPGSADFDTTLNARDGVTCVALGTSDDFCGLQSYLQVIARGDGDFNVAVRGFGTAFGAYVLAFRDTGPTPICPSCAEPRATLPLATVDCQCIPIATTRDCTIDYLALPLVRGRSVTIGFCSCPGAGADGNSTLVLVGPNCGTAVAESDDSCGVGAQIAYTATVTGVFKIAVAEVNGFPMTGTLCYRIVPPRVVTIMPASGPAGSVGCSRSETFTATTQSAGPVTWAWTITPPPGGSAVPRSGTSITPTGTLNFTSRLTGSCAANLFNISVSAANPSATDYGGETYTLRDVTPPRVRPPASQTVACTSPVPGGAPVVLDNCDRSPTVTMTETTIPGSCPGNRVIRRTFVATDCAGNASAPAVQVITVRDTVPPRLTPDTAMQRCLDPPNGYMACYTQSDFAPGLTDGCSPPLTWRFVAIVDSEAGVPPPCNTTEPPDFTIAADGGSFCVRAELCVDDSAVSAGRRYTVLATATDACGNTSAPTPVTSILVPTSDGDRTGCRTAPPP